eukprot:TRINITY_DN4658_c0_g1_i3.p1 TRINITY_DN4658_c0_g1~~TRINITY_DN4658_c0_g1_i3.p1  ORF type:complete len:605 (-),score=120.13 TRINITY_DN4658_c0_g1_i3:350-2164(-)
MWGSSISQCDRAAQLTAATQRRLLQDLKKLQEEPIPLAAAEPCTDDLTLWNGIIGVEMEIPVFGLITVPLHFLIDFPADYPQSAPNIGFSFEFQYNGGAHYTMPDGRLKGKKVICLDILGNFGGMHTEWKQTVGSGWSPAYTVTTLLVQLQSVLCDLGKEMSSREREITYQSAVRFAEKNPSAVLQILDADEIRELKQRKRLSQALVKVLGGDEALALRAESFAKLACFADDDVKMHEFITLLGHIGSASTAGGSSPRSSEESAEVDTNICCFSTGKLYTEALLGVGVSRSRNNLATAGELLAQEAFDGGLRQNTNKSPFEFFLPVWINAAHAEKSEAWRACLKASVLRIGVAVYNVREGDSAILEVFPRLINQLIVEMMRPDAAKSEAIATFEAMCNFWRTFRWLVDTRPSLQKKVSESLTRFVNDESKRHKDHTPDLGVMLVLFTVFQDSVSCPARQGFVDAYLDENSLRWVMWWQRAGAKPESTPVFEATRVSREICMFQLMVVDVVIGQVVTLLKEVERTNCKLSDRLETLQSQWRDMKKSTDSWGKYFENIGATRPNFASTNDWIGKTVQRAAAKGPKYGGESKGHGKGKSSGKGKGQW